MRISGLMILMAVVLTANVAEARRTPWYNWIFTPGKADYERPYTHEGKIPHNSQFADDTWTPEHWTQDLGSKEAVIARFEETDYIKDIDVDGNAATLQVGVPFLMLSDLEKNHLVKYVDYAYGITKSGQGTITIERDDAFWPFKRATPVGIYSQNGLQLQ